MKNKWEEEIKSIVMQYGNDFLRKEHRKEIESLIHQALANERKRIADEVVRVTNNSRKLFSYREASVQAQKLYDKATAQALAIINKEE